MIHFEHFEPAPYAYSIMLVHLAIKDSLTIPYLYVSLVDAALLLVRVEFSFSFLCSWMLSFLVRRGFEAVAIINITDIQQH